MRASKSSLLLTEPKVKKDLISKTLESYLLEWHIQNKYGRKKDFSNRYTEKGLYNESKSLEIYNRVTLSDYVSPFKYYEDDFFCGTPDSNVIKETGIDIKSSYDIFTFFNSVNDVLSKAYECQNQIYMHLTGAKKWKTVFVLENSPEFIIEREKRFLLNKFNADNMQEEQIELYHKMCENIDKNHNYDDIPESERSFEFEVEYDAEIIEKMKTKVELCRNILNTYK